MRDNIRRILKVAAPFGVMALGLYAFMPNFKLLGLGTYRSQALIHLERLFNAADHLRYDLFTPQSTKDWNLCAGWAVRQWISEPLLDGPRKDRILKKGEALILKECGPHPEGLDPLP